MLTYACDLTDAEAREALWDYVARRGLRFYMLFNVAGVDCQGPFRDRQVEELHTIVRLNVEATVEITRRILAYRDPVRTLRVINVSSLAAFYPMPIKAVYAASKRFLLDWSLALDAEIRDHNVTITALCPAGMPTNPMCMRAIEAQRVLGRWTTMNTSEVAARTVDRALAGRRVFIPGVLNRILRALGAVVPRPLLALTLNAGLKHTKNHMGHRVRSRRLSLFMQEFLTKSEIARMLNFQHFQPSTFSLLTEE